MSSTKVNDYVDYLLSEHNDLLWVLAPGNSFYFALQQASLLEEWEQYRGVDLPIKQALYILKLRIYVLVIETKLRGN